MAAESRHRLDHHHHHHSKRRLDDEPSPTLGTAADPQSERTTTTTTTTTTMADYVVLNGGVGGALVPPGTTLERMLAASGSGGRGELDDGGRRRSAAMTADAERHLKLVEKSPPAPFLRDSAVPQPRSPTTMSASALSRTLASPTSDLTRTEQVTKEIKELELQTSRRPAKPGRLGYQELLQKLQTPELFQNFMAQTREQDLFQVVYNSAVAQNFRPRMARKGKDAGVAAKLEKKGFTCFVEKNYAEAMRYYNQAALVAPPKTELLGMIFCHRSAVSFLWGDYENCLDDVNRALSVELPEQSRKRLEFRRSKCEILLKMSSGNLVDKEGSDLSSNAARQRLESLRLKKVQKAPLPPRLTGGPSAKVSTASNRLDCTFSEDSGRHYVAAVDVEPGDVLAVEEPYAKICVPTFWKTHCQHCLKRCDIVIPCNLCSLVCFCSERCQDSATVYHAIECTHILDLRLLGENTSTLLAYRMFTQEGVEFFQRWAPVLAQIDNFPRHNLIFGHKTRVRNFPAVYTTLTHVWDRNPMVSFRAAAAAIYLVKSLEEASYFSKSPKKKEAENRRFIGQLLFHCILAVSSNFFSLPENQPLATVSDISTVPEVGSGFFPNASFFNHSCFPEAMHFFVGNYIVCRALLPVETGDQIHISYGKYFYCDSKAERQSWLATNYFFTCTCLPCRLNWSTFNDLPDRRRLRCPVCDRGHEDVEEHFAAAAAANGAAGADDTGVDVDGSGVGTLVLRDQWRARVDTVEALERRFFKVKRKLDRGVPMTSVKRAIPLSLEYLRTLYDLYECPNKSFLHIYDFIGDMFQLEPFSKAASA